MGKGRAASEQLNGHSLGGLGGLQPVSPLWKLTVEICGFRGDRTITTLIPRACPSVFRLPDLHCLARYGNHAPGLRRIMVGVYRVRPRSVAKRVQSGPLCDVRRVRPELVPNCLRTIRDESDETDEGKPHPDRSVQPNKETKWFNCHAGPPS